MCASILVIDDDPVNLELMTYLLCAFGHLALPATGAHTALEAIAQSPVDLVLCDIQMPEIDGIQFLQMLEQQRRRSVPVIAITALAMVGDREKLLSAGFDGYVAKPIVPETFVSEIEGYLPNAESLAPPPLRIHDRAATEEPRVLSRKSGRILVVDDIAANIEVLRVVLHYAGYGVDAADCAEDALEMARLTGPDLILSDINMPGESGFQLITAIKSDKQLRGTPVIFISATAQQQSDIDRGMALGARGFLLRPIEPELLLAAIDDCLTSEAQPS